MKEWSKSYDRIMMCWEGELCIFGGHYTLAECLKLIEEDNYDEPTDWKNSIIEHQYAKFGIINYAGDISSGWLIKNEYKKGRVICTVLTKQFE